MNRAQRRAATRLSEKSAATSTISPAQLAANQANAQLSTGAQSPEGRAVSSLNALKTGLTGRTVVLPTDDAAVYQSHIDRVFAHLAPKTDEERALAQSIADTEWRLLRIAPLEAGIYALGQRELSGHFSDEAAPPVRHALIQAEIFRVYRKDLGNLALQERRLRNHRNADIQELKALQQARIEHEVVAEQATAYRRAAAAETRPEPETESQNGFVFSDPEMLSALIDSLASPDGADEEEDNAQAA